MINIAILGFGVVGGGIAEVISENKELIKKSTGEEINIKYIFDRRTFENTPYEKLVTTDFDIIVNDPSVDIICETMGGSHPAYELSLKALKAGKHVVTSNKEVVCNFGKELLELAKENNKKYLFEASVGGGIPVIRGIREALAGNIITEINGILNGTTNYILTQMEHSGKDFAEALKEAQRLGYAEANPDADILGIDSRRKICILSAISYGKIVSESCVSTEGISNITLDDILLAKKCNAKIKLVGSSKLTPEGICITVSPAFVRIGNPLYLVEDVYNSILVNGSTIGNIMFYGMGAGRLPTASAVLADIMNIINNEADSSLLWDAASESQVFDFSSSLCKYYAFVEDDAKTVTDLIPEAEIICTDGGCAFICKAESATAFSDLLASLKVKSSFRAL